MYGDEEPVDSPIVVSSSMFHIDGFRPDLSTFVLFIGMYVSAPVFSVWGGACYGSVGMIFCYAVNCGRSRSGVFYFHRLVDVSPFVIYMLIVCV